jgi:tetratricopeptide (TPR) repeat protein
MRYLIVLVLLIVFSIGCKSKKESSEFFKRGNFHFKKNELDKAEHFFNEAIKKDESFADAYNNRGAVFLKKGEIDKATLDFETAVKIDAKFIDARFNLARVYSEQGKYGEAEALFKDLEPQMKNSSEFYNYFAQNHIGLNHWDQGKDLLLKSLSINSNNLEALTNLGYVFLIEKKFEKASEYLDKALKINPEFVFALNNKAVLAGREKNFSGGIIYLEKAIEKEPVNQIFLNNMAFLLIENGQLNEGNDFIRKSEIINAADPYLNRNKALVFLKNNKLNEAEAILLNLEKDSPDVEYLYYYLHNVYEKLGNTSKACKYLKTGQKIGDTWCLNIKSSCN